MIFTDRIKNEKIYINRDSLYLNKISDDEYFGKEYKDIDFNNGNRSWC